MDVFDKVKGKLGFGCMRLPMRGDEVDREEVCRMVDDFLAHGFNYFDTAHGYIGGKSETALRDCLTSRYDRSAYLMANKLSDPFFEDRAGIRPFFRTQLEATGAGYFDYYLIHAVGPWNYDKYRACGAFEEAAALKADGLVRHVGFSFHGDAALMERVLREKGDLVEFVQLQINYLDYDDESVQGRKLIGTVTAAGLPVVVMEPVKGGALVDLPASVRELFGQEGMRPADAAFAFAASRPGVRVVLSGMSNRAQMLDNLRIFAADPSLTREQEEILAEAVRRIRAIELIGCTSCRYCTKGCPAGIDIPGVFAAANQMRRFGVATARGHYAHVTKTAGPDDCLACGACEQSCPQHLPIRDLLREAGDAFRG